MMRTVTHTLRNVAKTAIACVIASAMAISLAACGSQETKPKKTKTAEKPISVVSTIDTWGSLAKEIGGDDVKVTSILSGSDTDISSFKPNSKNSKDIQDAQVLLVNGAGYDDWITKIRPKNAEFISAASTVGALNGDNPYLWFSNDARNAVASAVTEALTRVKPDKRKVFNDRLSQWQDREKKLEEYIKKFSKEHSSLQYASTSSILFWLMSDIGLKDSTPKSYSDAINQGNLPDKSSIDEFQKLIEGRHIDILINDTQQSDDNYNRLVGIAGRSYTSTVSVSELMPSYAKSLDQWITKICDDMNNAANNTKTIREALAKDEDKKTDNTDAQEPITENPHPVEAGKPNSNKGQQDPGK